MARSNPDVAVAGLIFGDTTDGGQFHMAYPGAATPRNMDGDPRFDDVAANKVAAGNYAFFKKYGAPALNQMAPGWQVIDTVEGEIASLVELQREIPVRRLVPQPGNSSPTSGRR